MVVGKISLIDGVFYVKRSQESNAVKLVHNDVIYKNDEIFGCLSNKITSCVFIDFNTGVEAVLSGCEEYVVDEYLYM